MRKYEPKYELKRLNKYFHPNLLRDGDGKGNVISEIITWFTLRRYIRIRKFELLDQTLREMESEVKIPCPKAELAYRDSSGNRWFFLLLNGNPSKDELDNMQEAYKKVYDPTFTRWKEKVLDQ